MKLDLNKEQRKYLLDSINFYLEQTLYGGEIENTLNKLGDKLYFKGYEYEE